MKRIALRATAITMAACFTLPLTRQLCASPACKSAALIGGHSQVRSAPVLPSAGPTPLTFRHISGRAFGASLHAPDSALASRFQLAADTPAGAALPSGPNAPRPPSGGAEAGSARLPVISRAAPLISRGDRIARTALAYRGVPYRFGGRSAQSGFDCSGLVQTVCAKLGIHLPRVAGAQFYQGVPVPQNELRSGDLVFFRNTYKAGLSHVGIFVGDGKFVHAAGRRKGVKISSLAETFYQNHWAGARRLDLGPLKLGSVKPVDAASIIEKLQENDASSNKSADFLARPEQPSEAHSAH